MLHVSMIQNIQIKLISLFIWAIAKHHVLHERQKYVMVMGESVSDLVVFNVERANEVVGEGRLSTFRTVTGDVSTCCNSVPRNLPCV